MSQTSQQKNKALVLEAFETLFNERDYVAAERFWSPNYIQHSAHIAPGREGLFNLIKGIPPTRRYEPGVISEGKLLQIIDTIPAQAWRCLPDGSVDYLNRRWHDYTGPRQVMQPSASAR